MSDSMGSTQSDLECLLIEAEIRRVLVAYCHGVDRKDWDTVRQCYHEDAHDSHGAFSGSVQDLLEWMQRNHENVTSSMHVLSNVTICISENRRTARTESYCLSSKELTSAKYDVFLADPDSTESARRTIACRFVDDFEYRTGAGWKIRSRVVAFEWIRREDAQSYVPIDPAWVRSRRDRMDQFYAPL